MGWMIWALLLPLCLLVAWLLVRRWLLHTRLVRVERAYLDFRLRRESLEARFLNILGKLDPFERLSWENAQWQDDVVWARDRQSGRLLALVGVHFENDPILDLPDHPPRRSTVLFEHHRGTWRCEGRHLDEIYPQEAFLRHHQFEPLACPPIRKA